MTDEPVTARPEFDVPDGEQPAATCPHCGRPFAEERSRALHVGEVHPDAWDDDERAAYEAAREAENGDLFYYHLKVVVALGVTYALTVLVYMVALGSGYL